MDTNIVMQDIPDAAPPVVEEQSPRHVSRSRIWGMKPEGPAYQEGHNLESDLEPLTGIEIDRNGLSDDGAVWSPLDNMTLLGLDLTVEKASATADQCNSVAPGYIQANVLGTYDLPGQTRPFNKWISNLQKRAGGRRQSIGAKDADTTIEKDALSSPSGSRRRGHKKSSSESSSGFVTAVKSASVSFVSVSVAPKSKRLELSFKHARGERSSKASEGARHSEDSSFGVRSLIIDQAVAGRSVQRRRILEELITTEEAYIADVKFLMNVSRAVNSLVPTN